MPTEDNAIFGAPRNQAMCSCSSLMGDNGCDQNTEVAFPDGNKLPSIPYLSEEDHNRNTFSHDEPCHDCGCSPGKFHHPGCDMEACPRCHNQAITCWCLALWPFYASHEVTRRLLTDGYRFVAADDVLAVKNQYPRLLKLFAAAGVTQADCVSSQIACDWMGNEAEGISFWTKTPKSD